jgi:hypothetical protein
MSYPRKRVSRSHQCGFPRACPRADPRLLLCVKGGAEAFFGVVMMHTTAPVMYRIPMHTTASCTPSFDAYVGRGGNDPYT